MGKYDEPELIRAIEKSLINADDLIEDATLLKENFRFARSYALYQLAMEEAGKALFIYSTILLDKLKTKEQKIQI